MGKIGVRRPIGTVLAASYPAHSLSSAGGGAVMYVVIISGSSLYLITLASEY